MQHTLEKLTRLHGLPDDATEVDGEPLKRGRPDKVDNGGYWPGGGYYAEVKGWVQKKRNSGSD